MLLWNRWRRVVCPGSINLLVTHQHCPLRPTTLFQFLILDSEHYHLDRALPPEVIASHNSRSGRSYGKRGGRGQGRGAGSWYSAAERNFLLDLVEEKLPLGGYEWDEIAETYAERFPANPRREPQRSCGKLTDGDKH